ncbi:uncharacterized protein [Cicer arietinum]|uniref:Phosphatidylinositol transfer protein CSR1 isoform X3 n=1 Tax=Cicer arietinum TaxID=3827 RepID=A0A3Q7XFL7_CICAR|nr:phosphatidylinositol transfer protein CSR1 isoform X3 [Cicer arietinum]
MALLRLYPTTTLPRLASTFSVRTKFVVRSSNLQLQMQPNHSRKKWRQDFEVSKLTEESVKDVAQTGKAYVHDFLDINDRPVLVVVAAKHFPKAQDPADDERLCVFLIEKALSKLPTGKEQILGIFDLRGFGTENADLKYLTFLFDVFYYYYPKRLSQVLFVDSPFVFKPIWQLIKPLLKSYASLKLSGRNILQTKLCHQTSEIESYFWKI